MTEATGTTTTIYSGNYIYQNDALQMISQPEGYIEPNISSSGVEMDYVYQYKDHLGNIRLTYKDDQLYDTDFNNGSYSPWTKSENTTSMTIEGDRLKVVTGVHLNGANGYYDLLAGETYQISVDVDRSLFTTDLEFSLWNGSSKIYGEYVTTSKTVTYDYTPTITATYRINFRLRDYGYDGGDQTFYLDNVIIRNTALAIIEENNYYPFGLKHQGYNNTVSSNANAVAGKFKYNGKELQDDLIGSNSLDLYDYGARFYDAALGRWHVIDPMCELARRWTPYQYAYSNPIRYIDHDGMVVDDYFNKDGIYLGKDEAPTDKVKIIDQEDWDKNKSIESDGTESIDHNSGEPLSIDHSASDISIDASLSVYEHYNPTDLPIVAQEAENGKGGMVHYAISENGITSAEIEIKLQGNKDSKISDHANEIKNLFEHEKQHNLDLKKVGIETFGKSSLQRREVRAVSHQINHSSFKGTRKGFQRSVIDYGIKFGMIQSIKSKPSTIQESKKIYRIDKQPINEFER